MVLEMRVANLDDFDDVFAKFKPDYALSGHLKFILFLANKHPKTTISWSPDCNVAEPVIIQRFEAANIDIALLKVYVGGILAWENPDHRFRRHQKFRIQDVPTLIRWEFGGITGRLECHEAHEVSKIDALAT